MLTYSPLSQENIEGAIALVRFVFPKDSEGQDSPEEAYKASLNKEGHQDFITRHNIKTLNYFVVKNAPAEKIIGVTGWYTENTNEKDVVWLGWYCLDPKERGKGLGREILEWTMNEVKMRGYTTMKLYTSEDPNEATAQILYEKLGFKITKEETREGETFKVLFRERLL
jgi:GNAT superfamily N-acetyltransferase